MDGIDRKQFGDSEWEVIWDYIEAAPEGAVIEFEGLANRLMQQDKAGNERKGTYNAKARKLGGLISDAVSDASCELFPLEFLARVEYPNLKAEKLGVQTIWRPTGTTSLKPAVNPSSKKLQYKKTNQDRVREQPLPKN